MSKNNHTKSITRDVVTIDILKMQYMGKNYEKVKQTEHLERWGAPRCTSHIWLDKRGNVSLDQNQTFRHALLLLWTAWSGKRDCSPSKPLSFSSSCVAALGAQFSLSTLSKLCTHYLQTWTISNLRCSSVSYLPKWRQAGTDNEPSKWRAGWRQSVGW